MSRVVLVDENGKNLGQIPKIEAEIAAAKVGLDLVEVAGGAKPPVFKIMDEGKYKYEQSQKEKRNRQNQQKVMTKEIRLSPKIADNDIRTKTSKARKFLKQGHSVQFRLIFKRRENAHRDLGFEVTTKVIELLSDCSSLAKEPKLEGNSLNCTIAPKKD